MQLPAVDWQKVVGVNPKEVSSFRIAQGFEQYMLPEGVTVSLEGCQDRGRGVLFSSISAITSVACNATKTQ